MLGIAPDKLLMRPIGYFESQLRDANPKVLGMLAKRKHSHSEQKRQNYLKAVRKERAKLIRKEEEGEEVFRVVKPSEGQAIRSVKKKVDSLLAQERRELIKLQELQVKKLASLLTYEVKQQRKEAQQIQMLERQKRKDEAQQKYKTKLMKDREQQMWIIEERRRQRMEEEERRRKEANQRFHERSRIQAQKSLLLDKERKKENALQAELSLKRQMDRQVALEEANRRREQEARAKEAHITAKEQWAQRMMEEKRSLKAREHAAKRERMHTRLEHARSKHIEVLEKKRRDFEARERYAEERRRILDQERQNQRKRERQMLMDKEMQRLRIKEQAEQRLEQRRLHSVMKEQQVVKRLQERNFRKMLEDREQALMESEREAKRKEVLMNNRRLEDERIEEIKRKRALQEERNLRAATQREMLQAEKRLEEQMIMEDRREHVERIRKAKEYERAKMLEKISMDGQKVKEMKKQYEVLHKQRRFLRHQHDEQRKKITERFNELRSSDKLKDLDPDDVDLIKLGVLDDTNAGFLTYTDHNSTSPGKESSKSPSTRTMKERKGRRRKKGSNAYASGSRTHRARY